MPYHRYHDPRIFRLTSSVGACGTNNPNEVKSIQRMINDAGYQFATVAGSQQMDNAILPPLKLYAGISGC